MAATTAGSSSLASATTTEAWSNSEFDGSNYRNLEAVGVDRVFEVPASQVLELHYETKEAQQCFDKMDFKKANEYNY